MNKEKDFSDKIVQLLKNNSLNDFIANFKDIIYEYSSPNLFTDYLSFSATNNNVNINEDRIQKYKLIAHLYSNMKAKCTFPLEAFIQIKFNANENKSLVNIMFWRSISSEVLTRKVLGFPACIFIDETTNNYAITPNNRAFYYLHFLKHKQLITTPFFSSVMEGNDQYLSMLFQKALIFYNLKRYNMSSDNYIFDEMPTNYVSQKHFYTFRIKDMIFNVPMYKIYILSPNTILVNQELNTQVYINSLNLLNTNPNKDKEYDDFFEFFFDNFLQFFVTTIYNSRSMQSIVEFSDEVSFISPGKLYILKKKSKPFQPIFVIALSKTETHIKFMAIFDSTLKGVDKKIIVIREEDPEFIFLLPNMLLNNITQHYQIG